MGIRVSITTDVKALNELALRLGSAGRMFSTASPVAQSIAQKSAQMLVGHVRESVYDSYNSRFGYSGRTGALARSYRESVSFSSGKMRIAAESDLIYARVQDQGGIIRPKTVKRLAIPLIPMAIGKWPRHWKRGELFRRGNALSTMRGGKPINVYALAKQVRIRPKRYLKRASEVALPRIAKLVGQEVVAEIARGR